ncbi:uncharacterized protein QC761_0014100 [Podospora bellae-mahoneyi]|uniref:Uncharacterized protein n=1 Tax=Podospora bellae-mahoneyi TaxID=2093777 RepID=A0ABR0FZ36_9PEZI|nr:hypothetical protein QC761_0014100 [Podospora bellae-mahoneyi]
MKTVAEVLKPYSASFTPTLLPARADYWSRGYKLVPLALTSKLSLTRVTAPPVIHPLRVSARLRHRREQGGSVQSNSRQPSCGAWQTGCDTRISVT